MKKLLVLMFITMFMFWVPNVFADTQSGDPLLAPLVENDLKAVNVAVDEDILTYEATTGDFEWHTIDEMVAIATLTDTYIFVGNASNNPIGVTMSGDTHISNIGAVTIQDNAVDGSDINLASEAAGDILYCDGADWVRLAKGTAGQVLEMNAGATAPEWDTDDDGGDPGSFGSETAKTIATGVADASGGENWIGLAGEGAAADDLDELQCAAVGDIIILSNPNAGSYTITVKDGTYIKAQADFALNSVDDIFVVICSATGANDTCKEIARASNG